MDYGVGFPSNEIADPSAMRAFAQAAEELGFNHFCLGDHVLGADISNRPGYTEEFPVTNKTLYHEPITLMGFLAGCTQRMGFATSILVLPQRQTALVAKQTAEIDVLCGGRLRLGIGIGRYEIEYEALGVDIHTRGRRVEEQVAVMRALWTQESVDFHGNYHDISGAGINPLPVQRPIPIWFGGGARSEAALKRIGRLADGWFPSSSGFGELAETLERLRGYARAAGRDPSAIPFEGRINITRGEPDSWRKSAQDWEKAGAGYLTVNTQGAGYTSVDRHIATIRRFKQALA